MRSKQETFPLLLSNLFLNQANIMQRCDELCLLMLDCRIPDNEQEIEFLQLINGNVQAFNYFLQHISSLIDASTINNIETRSVSQIIGYFYTLAMQNPLLRVMTYDRLALDKLSENQLNAFVFAMLHNNPKSLALNQCQLTHLNDGSFEKLFNHISCLKLDSLRINSEDLSHFSSKQWQMLRETILHCGVSDLAFEFCNLGAIDADSWALFLSIIKLPQLKSLIIPTNLFTLLDTERKEQFFTAFRHSNITTIDITWNGFSIQEIERLNECTKANDSLQNRCIHTIQENILKLSDDGLKLKSAGQVLFFSHKSHGREIGIYNQVNEDTSSPTVINIT